MRPEHREIPKGTLLGGLEGLDDGQRLVEVLPGQGPAAAAPDRVGIAGSANLAASSRSSVGGVERRMVGQEDEFRPIVAPGRTRPARPGRAVGPGPTPRRPAAPGKRLVGGDRGLVGAGQLDLGSARRRRRPAGSGRGIRPCGEEDRRALEDAGELEPAVRIGEGLGAHRAVARLEHQRTGDGPALAVEDAALDRPQPSEHDRRELAIPVARRDGRRADRRPAGARASAT